MAVIDQELVQYKDKITHLVDDSISADLRELLVNFAATLLSLLMNDHQQAVRRLVFNEVRRSPEIGEIVSPIIDDFLKAYFKGRHYE
jgi:hypothetical protein